MNEDLRLGRYGRKWTSDIFQFVEAEIPVMTSEGKTALLDIINNIWKRNLSRNAFTTAMSEAKIHFGIKSWQNNSGKFRGNEPLALYSERVKKGYVTIKTPEGWMQKSRYVYQKAHPDYIYQKYDNFIFLDGNLRNFDPSNIELLNKRLLPAFLHAGGVVKEHPELTAVNLAKARLTMAILDSQEKRGRVIKYVDKRTGKISRVDLDHQRDWQRKKYSDPEFRKKISAQQTEKRHLLKVNNPEAYEKLLERERIRRRKNK